MFSAPSPAVRRFRSAAGAGSVLRPDLGDHDLGERLAVAALLGPAFLLLPEVDDLLVLRLGDDLALDGGAADGRAADLGLTLAADEQRVERHLAADVADELLDLEPVALRDAVLLAAGPNHRVHRLLLGFLGGFATSRAARARPPALRKGGHIRSGRQACQGIPGVTARTLDPLRIRGVGPLIAGPLPVDAPRPCARSLSVSPP